MVVWMAEVSNLILKPMGRLNEVVAVLCLGPDPDPDPALLRDRLIF